MARLDLAAFDLSGCNSNLKNEVRQGYSDTVLLSCSARFWHFAVIA
jgi:hypothetical protein